MSSIISFENLAQAGYSEVILNLKLASDGTMKSKSKITMSKAVVF